MLRDSYAISFLQVGGELATLQGQLGVTDLASVRRYQRSCNEHQRVEASVQTLLEGQSKPPGPGKKTRRNRKGKR